MASPPAGYDLLPLDGAPTLPGVLEASLYVDDLDSAAKFYGEILELELVLSVEGRHIFYRCGETIVLLFVADKTREATTNSKLPVPPHGAEGAGHICFAASGKDLDRWRMKFEKTGIAIEADFNWPNGARSIYVRDPAGNSVEFAEPKLWGID